jgi:dienelactone hydrolase
MDALVDPAQSQTLASMLLAKGVPSQYVFYPTEGHGWFGSNLGHSFNMIQAFISTHVE